MGAIILPFETRAQREERLHRELIAAYQAYVSVEAPKRFDALVQALERLIAFQRRHTRPRPCVASHAREVAQLAHRSP